MDWMRFSICFNGFSYDPDAILKLGIWWDLMGFHPWHTRFFGALKMFWTKDYIRRALCDHMQLNKALLKPAMEPPGSDAPRTRKSCWAVVTCCNPVMMGGSFKLFQCFLSVAISGIIVGYSIVGLPWMEGLWTVKQFFHSCFVDKHQSSWKSWEKARVFQDG